MYGWLAEGCTPPRRSKYSPSSIDRTYTQSHVAWLDRERDSVECFSWLIEKEDLDYASNTCCKNRWGSVAHGSRLLV